MKNLLLFLLAFFVLASCSLTRPQPPTDAKQTVSTVKKTGKSVTVDSSRVEATERVVSEQTAPAVFRAVTFSADSLDKHGSASVTDASGLTQLFTKDRKTGLITAHFYAPGATTKTTTDRHTIQQTQKDGEFEWAEDRKDSTATQHRDFPPPGKQRTGLGSIIHGVIFGFRFACIALLAALCVACFFAVKPVYLWLSGGWLRNLFLWFVNLFRNQKKE